MNDEPIKHDEGKPRMSLIPPKALREIASVLTFGAKKYTADNWRIGEGFEYSRVYDSLQRHLNSWYSGEDLDPETGKSHLAHAGSCIMFLLDYEFNGKGRDDRYKYLDNE